MIYDIKVTGQFLGIESITAVQTFPLSIRCFGCKNEFDKYICISHLTFNKDFSSFCQECNKEVSLAINPLNLVQTKCVDAFTRKQIIRQINVNKDSPSKSFQISQIKGVNFEILDIPRIEFSVLSKKYFYYEDVPIEDGSWSSNNNDDPNVFIDCFNVEFMSILEEEILNECVSKNAL